MAILKAVVLRPFGAQSLIVLPTNVFLEFN